MNNREFAKQAANLEVVRAALYLQIAQLCEKELNLISKLDDAHTLIRTKKKIAVEMRDARSKCRVTESDYEHYKLLSEE